MQKPLIIGIAGGTASGKTSIANAIRQEFQTKLTILRHDNYYKNFQDLCFEDRSCLNYDHPHTYETTLLIDHIKALKQNVPIETPIYSFEKHLRTDRTKKLLPTPIVIVEGILVFENKQLRDLMDIKIFVDTAPDIRVLRRIERDINDRGRSLESVMQQYRQTVRPMHNEFVEPSKRFADVIIPRGGANLVGIEMILARIRTILD